MSTSFTTYRPDLLHIPPPTPVMDDVVIRSGQECPTDYILGREHAPGQMRYSSYASALAVAKQWAIRQQIDVWFDDHGHDFILLSRHRPDGSD